MDAGDGAAIVRPGALLIGEASVSADRDGHASSTHESAEEEEGETRARHALGDVTRRLLLALATANDRATVTRALDGAQAQGLSGEHIAVVLVALEPAHGALPPCVRDALVEAEAGSRIAALRARFFACVARELDGAREAREALCAWVRAVFAGRGVEGALDEGPLVPVCTQVLARVRPRAHAAALLVDALRALSAPESATVLPGFYLAIAASGVDPRSALADDARLDRDLAARIVARYHAQSSRRA